jgi:hypothetical protein
MPLLPVLGILINAFMLLQLSWQVLSIGIGLTVLGVAASFFIEQS